MIWVRSTLEEVYVKHFGISPPTPRLRTTPFALIDFRWPATRSSKLPQPLIGKSLTGTCFQVAFEGKCSAFFGKGMIADYFPRCIFGRMR